MFLMDETPDQTINRAISIMVFSHKPQLAVGLCLCLFTSQESTPLSPQCSLKVGRLLQLIFQQSVRACVCVASVCPEISHRNFLITQRQAVFWVSVVPTTRLCLVLDFNSQTLSLTHAPAQSHAHTHREPLIL